MPTIRPAQPRDTAAISQVFMKAFAQSVAHAGVGPRAAGAIADLFTLVLRADPGCVLVAEEDGAILGYVIAPVDTGRLQSTILRQGGWWRMLGRLLAGRYGVTWRTLRTLLADKLTFQRGTKLHSEYQARILSIGVSPDAQGRGLGRLLLTAALEHLRRRGAQGVRLEVRPENAPAVHLYESFGFAPRGEYRDGQGAWLIMLKDGWDETEATGR